MKLFGGGPRKVSIADAPAAAAKSTLRFAGHSADGMIGGREGGPVGHTFPQRFSADFAGRMKVFCSQASFDGRKRQLRDLPPRPSALAKRVGKSLVQAMSGSLLGQRTCFRSFLGSGSEEV
jgi:hypothetical protein